jgi:energy-coupling factor transport system ATP-binding protein
MIKFSRVSLIYPHSITTVIEDLSFEVSEGEMVLVMGHTGAGKSSLLRLMNGLVPHHTGGILAGEITIDGHSTRTMRPGELAGIVGIVGQNPIDSFVADTVEEEIVFGMESLNYSPDVMRKRVEEVLDQVHYRLQHQRARRLRGPARDDQAPLRRLRGHLGLRLARYLSHSGRLQGQGLSVHSVPDC